MRCIKMIAAFDAVKHHVKILRGELDPNDVLKDSFDEHQCPNPAFGYHDFCIRCLRWEVWKFKEMKCSLCRHEIDNPVNATLAYATRLPNFPAPYAGGGSINSYTRMHILCQYCGEQFKRRKKKPVSNQLGILRKMGLDSLTFDEYAEIVKKAKESSWEWERIQEAEFGVRPGPHERASHYHRQLRRFRDIVCPGLASELEDRNLKQYHPGDLSAGYVTAVGTQSAEGTQSMLCDGCGAEGVAMYQMRNEDLEDEIDTLCWVCKTECDVRDGKILMPSDPKLRSKRSNGLCRRIQNLIGKIDELRLWEISITLEDEEALRMIVAKLRPDILRPGSLYHSSKDRSGYRKELRRLERLLVTQIIFEGRCPACKQVVVPNLLSNGRTRDGWAIDFKQDNATCEECARSVPRKWHPFYAEIPWIGLPAEM